MTARIAGYVSRKQAGLAAPRSTTPLNGRRMEGVAVHHGAGRTPKAHSECAGVWRDYQRIHMTDPSDPKVDIAYSYGVCPHGYVFEGRGWKVQPGANGIPWKNGYHPNRTNFAVCAIGSGNVVFSTLVTDAIEWCINECRTKGNAGNRVRPHSYFAQTGCPDTKLRAWAASMDGKPIQTVSNPAPPGTAGTVRQGDRGLLVGQTQEYLDALGYDVGKIDGVAGPMFDAAVRAFQTNNGLDVDGVAGPNTLTQLRSKDAIMARLHPDDIKAISADVWRATGVTRAADPNARDGKVSALQELADAKTLGLRNEARLATVEAAVGALSQAQGLDPAKVEEILSGAVDKALADLRIVKGDGPTVTPSGYVSGVSHTEGVRGIEDVDKITQEA